MKYILFIILLITIPLSKALLITEILFDPNGSENDLEFVELYNNENKTINLSNLIIATASYPKDAQIPNNTFLKKGNHFLIADKGFNDNKEDYWAESDYEEEMTFVNTNGFINILKQDNVIANVSWNKSFKEGYSLNYDPTTKEKFFALPSPVNSKTISYSNAVKIQVKLNDPQIRIENITIKDEDLSTPGVQVYPFPGKQKNLELNVKVTDGSGYQDIKKLIINFNKNEFIQESFTNHTTDSKEFKINQKIPYNLTPGNYSINIIATSNSKQDEKEISIQILKVSAFMLDVDEIYFETSISNDVVIYGDNNISTFDKPTIKNIGNSDIRLQISSSGLKDGDKTISANALSVGLCEDNCDLNDLKTNYISPPLKPGSSYPFYIEFISDSKASAGTYSGYININSIS